MYLYSDCLSLDCCSAALQCYDRSKVALGHNLALSSNKSRETREISPQSRTDNSVRCHLRVMQANTTHSYPTRKLSRHVGTLSSVLTASILRESSRQHWCTLFDPNTLLG